MGKTKKKKGTKQQLEYVEEEKKLHISKIKFRSEKQKKFLKVLEDHEITFCTGPAGTAKSFTACYAALKALEKGKINQILLMKPNIDIPGYELGYLPGDQSDKLDPYMMSYMDQLDKILGEDQRKWLFKEGKIKFIPIAYIRGRTFENSYCIIDEAQNCNSEAFKTIITRIGIGSQYCILGDISQIDFKKKSESVLEKIVKLFTNDKYVGVFEFTEDDVVRHPLITHILKKLKTME